MTKKKQKTMKTISNFNEILHKIAILNFSESIL